MKVHLLKLGQYSAAFLATATMTFSPVAMGKQAEKVTKQSITENIRYYGLNKTQTVDQFWQKIKAEVPGPLYKGLESVVKNNKNVKMPNVSVKEVVGTDGVRVPALTIDQGGKITTVQFFGEKKKWITVNGKAYTEQQIHRAVAQADKQQATAANSVKIQQYRKDFARFEGFPRVTPQLWKLMTREQRAGYLVKMRQMWLDARRVISQQSSSTFKKQSAPKKKSASIENFYQIIFGAPAEAQSASVYTAERCVVAGYIGNYDAPITNRGGQVRPGGGCSVSAAIAQDRYSSGDLEFVSRDNSYCATNRGSSYVACNPIVYGYARNSEEGQTVGQPICVDRQAAEFQIATQFPGPCDTVSRLSTSEEVVRPSEDYSSPNLAARISAIEADQMQDRDFALTREYLTSVFKNRGNRDLQQILDGEWTQDIDNEIIQIQTQFEAEIQTAMTTCAASLQSGAGSHEPNQRRACDQLHRRWLFTERIIAQYRQKGCIDNSTYEWGYTQGASGYASGDRTEATRKNRTNNIVKQNGDTPGTADMCRCPGTAGNNGRLVAFGAPCATAPQPGPQPDPDPQPDPTPAQCTDPRYASIVSSLTADCKCRDDGDDPEPKDGQYTCDDDGGGFPWLLVGGGLVALGLGLCVFGVICGGDDDDKPPKCRNGQPAPNGDPSQCVFCADNSPAPGGNVANCPVTCPNGTQVTPPATCPTNLCPDGSPRPANGICPDTPPPLCPGTQTPAPGGNVANCPVYCPGTQTPAPNNDASKCPVTCPGGQVVTPPATCPPVCEPGFSGNPCVCTRTCSAGFTLNPSACRCDENPAPSEGGGGQPQCQNPPCSGGLPGTGN